jgi:acetyltransferase-like isoleucine patch superfamily enzyme
MTVRDWIPPELLEYMRLIRARLRYRRCRMDSGRIADDAVLGDGCIIHEGCEIGHGVSIGRYSYLNQRTIVGSGSIGSFCSIGYDCQIGMPEHPLDRLSTSPFTYGSRNIFGQPATWNDFPAPPVVGHDVWVGSRAVVLQGVRIGDGAVIAAGAVVTKDIEPYTIAGGIPARPMKKRFDEKTIEFLTGWRWWERMDPDNQLLAGMFVSSNWVGQVGLGAAPEVELCNR